MFSTLVEEKLLSVERGHDEASPKSSTGIHIILPTFAHLELGESYVFSDITFVGGAEMLAC